MVRSFPHTSFLEVVVVRCLPRMPSEHHGGRQQHEPVTLKSIHGTLCTRHPCRLKHLSRCFLPPWEPLVGCYLLRWRFRVKREIAGASEERTKCFINKLLLQDAAVEPSGKILRRLVEGIFGSVFPRISFGLWQIAACRWNLQGSDYLYRQRRQAAIRIIKPDSAKTGP